MKIVCFFFIRYWKSYSLIYTKTFIHMHNVVLNEWFLNICCNFFSIPMVSTAYRFENWLRIIKTIFFSDFNVSDPGTTVTTDESHIPAQPGETRI